MDSGDLGRVVFVSARLSTQDGRGARSRAWQNGFRRLGASVTTAAGEGEADHLLPGLLARGPLEEELLAPLLSEADVVVVEDLSLFPPLVARFLLAARPGRLTLCRHHLLPWQPGGSGELPLPAQGTAVRHVTVNERSRLELEARGIRAVTSYPAFEPHPPTRTRDAARRLCRIAREELLVLQPTRGGLRKNVAGGLLLAAALGASYWLLGPVEASSRRLLDQLVDETGVVLHEGLPAGADLADAYGAADLVALPSSFESFGNAAIESAFARRPFAVGRYPVATELRRYGFSWFECTEPAPIARFLANADPFVLERNASVATLRFSSDDLPARLLELVTDR